MRHTIGVLVPVRVVVVAVVAVGGGADIRLQRVYFGGHLPARQGC